MKSELYMRWENKTTVMIGASIDFDVSGSCDTIHWKHSTATFQNEAETSRAWPYPRGVSTTQDVPLGTFDVLLWISDEGVYRADV